MELHFIHSVVNTVLFVNISKYHGLIAGGGEDGAVECFDMRVKSSVARLNAVTSVGDGDEVVLLFFSCILEL